MSDSNDQIHIIPYPKKAFLRYPTKNWPNLQPWQSNVTGTNDSKRHINHRSSLNTQNPYTAEWVTNKESFTHIHLTHQLQTQMLTINSNLTTPHREDPEKRISKNSRIPQPILLMSLQLKCYCGRSLNYTMPYPEFQHRVHSHMCTIYIHVGRANFQTIQECPQAILWVNLLQFKSYYCLSPSTSLVASL